MTRRPTKTERLALDRLYRNLARYEDESRLDWAIRQETPAAWETLLEDLDVEEPKVKVTLWLDESVAKFYRGMGKGYQARINRVLATFAQMKIAQVRRMERRLDMELADLEARLAAEQGGTGQGGR